jgi:hypothetical protein
MAARMEIPTLNVATKMDESPNAWPILSEPRQVAESIRFGIHRSQ